MDSGITEFLRWRPLPDRRQALEFTEQGWALAEACAQLSEYGRPQALIVFLLGRVLGELVERDLGSGSQVGIEWHEKDRVSAGISFQIDALKALAGACDMEVGELQNALLSSLELALLDMYGEHKDSQQLH